MKKENFIIIQDQESPYDFFGLLDQMQTESISLFSSFTRLLGTVSILEEQGNNPLHGEEMNDLSNTFAIFLQTLQTVKLESIPEEMNQPQKQIDA